MFHMIIKKIKNKMWLTCCLLLGMAFLVAVFACQPMFKEGSLNMLLDTSFRERVEENNEYPVVIGRPGAYNVDSLENVEQAFSGIDSYHSVWMSYLTDIDVLAKQTYIYFDEESCQGSYGSKGNYLKITYMKDMEQHIELLKGEGFNATEATAPYTCIIPQTVMDEYGLIEGEVLNFVNWKDEKGDTLKLQITGIFKEGDSSDLYWYVEPNEYIENIFVDSATFDEIMSKYRTDSTSYTVSYKHYTILDYMDINSANVDDIEYYMQEFAKADNNFFCSFQEIIDSYKAERKTVNIILWVLELPILGMVLAFIFMVSKQIVEAEKNEIAMHRSRGLSRPQVIAMYTLQASIIAFLGLLVGIPLSYLLCKLAAGTTDFLTFSFENIWMYTFTPEMLLYGLIAGVIGIVFILVPVISATKVTIVEHKSQGATNKKPAWEKYFFDVIILGVSIYLLYNFNQDQDNIRRNAMAGSKMDPMIFLDSLFFIIGLGLVVLRLTHYLVKLVYKIGEKRWKPSMYASFLQITRTTAKQGFISVFLILTVSLGLFNANTARTINRNNEDRINYENGADVVMQEKWDIKIFFIPVRDVDYEYKEPDYNKYQELMDNGVCDSITKVIYDDKTTVSYSGKDIKNCQLRGIVTDEFGKTAIFKDELNKDTHWYNHLNAMGAKQNGVVISSNLAKELGINVGDTFRASRMGAISQKEDTVRGTMVCQVCAIVDDWPGYDRYYYDENGDLKENYLVVANYATVSKSFKISPYEVWMKLNEGKTYSDVEAFLSEKKVELEHVKVIDEDVTRMKNSPMIQITNGMFTLSFIIALILCAIGFLIYWISSIRQRELLFGVYRAMGMSLDDVNGMLINEHIFSTFLSVIAGGVVGMVSTLLFVKLFGIVYLPEKHNLDIYIYFEAGDIIKLSIVVVLMILVCILVLRKLIKSLNIAQALKLGEE